MIKPCYVAVCVWQCTASKALVHKVLYVSDPWITICEMMIESWIIAFKSILFDIDCDFVVWRTGHIWGYHCSTDADMRLVLISAILTSWNRFEMDFNIQDMTSGLNCFYKDQSNFLFPWRNRNKKAPPIVLRRWQHPGQAACRGNAALCLHRFSGKDAPSSSFTQIVCRLRNVQSLGNVSTIAAPRGAESLDCFRS